MVRAPGCIGRLRREAGSVRGRGGAAAAAAPACAGRRLPDAALVPIVGVCRDDDAVIVVRALDPGVSLVRLMSIGSLAARHVGALAEGILQGLAALEARGLVHGAIHPGNVFIGEEGRITLSDAGLASQPFPHTQRRADLEATASLLLDVWGPTRRATNPALATHLEQRGFSSTGDAAGALQALLEVWPSPIARPGGRVSVSSPGGSPATPYRPRNGCPLQP